MSQKIFCINRTSCCLIFLLVARIEKNGWTELQTILKVHLCVRIDKKSLEYFCATRIDIKPLIIIKHY